MMTETGVLPAALILWVLLLVAATVGRAVVDGIVKAVRNPGAP
jgi:chromate transport protein ChrA